MKKIGLIVFTIFCFFQQGSAQDLVGKWKGNLESPAGSLKIIIDITKTASGYTSTLSSPDQGAMDIPTDATEFKDGTVSFSLAKFALSYKGAATANEIKGIFTQGGAEVPLTLTRTVNEKVENPRPQEPKPPFPYLQEERKIYNENAGDTLAGTLTMPAGKGPFTLAILVTGSGPQNRDETMLGHKPFLLLSDYLTRNGIAVFRYDDRGVGKSTGKFKGATTADFASDASAVVKYFMAQPGNIDAGKIGIVGHSEGGLIGPLVASENKDVAFVVMLSGPALTGGDILLMQQELIGRADGVLEKDLLKTKALHKGAFDIMKSNKPDSIIRNNLGVYLRKEMGQVSPQQMAEGRTLDDEVNLQVAALMEPWMNYFIKYDPVPALEKVKCPVLAIAGDFDLQVPATENLAGIEKALKTAGNKRVTVKNISGLNHLLQHTETGRPAEYGKITETMAPEVLLTVKDWLIKEIVKDGKK